MHKSKRFVAFITAVIMFISMVFLTEYAPMELAGAITMIVGVYLGAQSYRSSHKNNNNNDV